MPSLLCDSLPHLGRCETKPFSPTSRQNFKHTCRLPVCKGTKQAREKALNEKGSIRQEKSIKGNCYGCGAPLQTSNSTRPGFVEPERYELKQKHRQLKQVICGRCQQLSNGAMIPAVQDSWSLHSEQKSGERLPLISPEDLKAELSGIRDSRALVVMLVDLLDASGSFINKIREISGKNPVILVGTKVDLLPKGTNSQDVESWLQNLTLAKKVNVIHTCTVSSKTSDSIPEVAGYIRKNRLGRDVYIVGAANVGKSAFCRALMREMSNALSRQYDAMAASSHARLPVESAMPGTTLKLIPLRAFHTGGHLIDTPGLHLPHRLPHMLNPNEARQLHPVGRLRPFVAPSLAQMNKSNDVRKATDPYFATYYWGGLARIDVQSQVKSATLTFYGPSALRIHTQAPSSHDNFGWDSELESEPSSHFGHASVGNVGGLQASFKSSVQSHGVSDSIADIAISGVSGWITISAKEKGLIAFRVWTPQGVQAYLRAPIPCPNPAVGF